MNYNNRIADICKKDVLSFNDILELSRLSSNDVDWSVFEKAEEVFLNILQSYGKSWDEYDPRYPQNPYHSGYELEDHIFITAYSGIAGSYWNNDAYYDHAVFMCRPY